jgi:hypothetical protein
VTSTGDVGPGQVQQLWNWLQEGLPGPDSEAEMLGLADDMCNVEAPKIGPNHWTNGVATYWDEEVHVWSVEIKIWFSGMDVVAHTYNPNYLGGGRIMSSGQTQQEVIETPFQPRN